VVAGHRGVADGEDQQDHTDQDVRERNSRTVAEEHGDRCPTGHRRQWGSGGNHKEGDGEYSQAAVPQLLRIALRNVRGCCGRIRW
jgi:hypothetical protein